MAYNRRAIAQVLSDKAIIEEREKIALSADTLLTANQLGLVPGFVVDAALASMAEELSTYTDEYFRRHDNITGHDPGQCSGRFDKKKKR